MSWLLVTILFYLILAIVFLVDKYLLTGSIPNPKLYTFYVGMLGAASLILIPFVGFYLPGYPKIILSVLAGTVFIYALFWFYKALCLFEASRVVPAISSLTPLFTFGLVYVFSLGREVLSFPEIGAFILLVFGSFLITAEKEKFINLKSVKVSAICAFFLSLSFVLLKQVYLVMPFWPGFIWTRIGGFLTALCFLIFMKEVKEEILTGKAKQFIREAKSKGYSEQAIEQMLLDKGWTEEDIKGCLKNGAKCKFGKKK